MCQMQQCKVRCAVILNHPAVGVWLAQESFGSQQCVEESSSGKKLVQILLLVVVLQMLQNPLAHGRRARSKRLGLSTMLVALQMQQLLYEVTMVLDSPQWSFQLFSQYVVRSCSQRRRSSPTTRWDSCSRCSRVSLGRRCWGWEGEVGAIYSRRWSIWNCWAFLVAGDVESPGEMCKPMCSGEWFIPFVLKSKVIPFVLSTVRDRVLSLYHSVNCFTSSLYADSSLLLTRPTTRESSAYLMMSFELYLSRYDVRTSGFPWVNSSFLMLSSWLVEFGVVFSTGMLFFVLC